jgi:hypothetical protein
LLPSVPALERLTRSVVWVWRSNTKMSKRPLVSPGTRFDSQEWKATRRASALRDGEALCRSTPDGGWVVLIPSVVPVCRSWTNTSVVPLVSPGTRLEANDQKATKRPSALMATSTESLSPAAPVLLTLTRWVVPGGWARAADGPSRATTNAARANEATRRHGRARRGWPKERAVGGGRLVVAAGM